MDIWQCIIIMHVYGLKLKGKWQQRSFDLWAPIKSQTVQFAKFYSFSGAAGFLMDAF